MNRFAITFVLFSFAANAVAEPPSDEKIKAAFEKVKAERIEQIANLQKRIPTANAFQRPAFIDKLKELRGQKSVILKATTDKGSFGFIGLGTQSLFFIKALDDKDKSQIELSYPAGAAYQGMNRRVILEGYSHENWTPLKYIEVPSLAVYVDRYEGTTPVFKKLELTPDQLKYGEIK